MAFWGHIAEWGANTVAPAVVGLAMNAKEHAEQVGGQAAEWAAKEVAPRAVGLAMEAQKHAEQVAEWGSKEVAPRAVGLAMEAQKHAEQVAPAVVGLAMNAKQHAEEISGHVAEWGVNEVAPRAVGLAMEAQKHAEQVAPAVVGLAMNTKEHAEQISGHVAHWGTHHFVPAAAGLAHNAAEVAKNAERHYEQASPAERKVIRGLVSVGLTLVAEGFGISLPKLLIGPILGATGFGTGKSVDGRGIELGAGQAPRLSRSSRSGRPIVKSLGPDTMATKKETENGALGVLVTIAQSAIVIESIVGLMAWLL
ncbi:hypothetical protein B0H65DRAFT_304054 [Neurospora tetraspora]|uniref:Uncharacterized protein n=1 Tax=Neurospora tetraspora TaxID=94610 RepID=A0AAE0JAW2_9PEZI|nr:hypothetical protein B0H65DRAFT_304054 [Neurospora tetraspora]